MLKTLFIENYALIDKLNIGFTSGFSVITGETGAGKSIILGALNLILGQRADTKLIRRGESKCTIEALFNLSAYNLLSFFEEHDLIYDAQTIIRREIYASGKSRAFVNDSPVTLNIMRELGDQLVDIHSQHKNLFLENEVFQLKVLDTLADNELLRKQYELEYKSWNRARKEYSALKEQALKSREQEDYIRFQLEQLLEAQLREEEQEELERESDQLAHAEEIKGALFAATSLLDGSDGNLINLLKECINKLSSIDAVYSPVIELVERLESCYIELKDIAREVCSKEEDIIYDPSRLELVNSRLDSIYSLQQKHRVNSVEELLTVVSNYQEELSEIESFDDRIKEASKRVDLSYMAAMNTAKKLSQSRKEAARLFEGEMKNRLKPLGMPHVQFKVKQVEQELKRSGIDHICFLFSANKNGELHEISSVASGGEIARVMLIIKSLIAQKVNLPTIIFDEIDTGVSGDIAEKMAKTMQQMGSGGKQVISITHLPQIAAKGETHYRVYKIDNQEGTISNIVRIEGEERVREVAQMLSGAVITEEALNNAKSLLTQNI